jgi:hypothetical protein
MPANADSTNARGTQTPFPAVVPPVLATEAHTKDKDTNNPPRRLVVVEWKQYMGEGALADWQRLMKDLGFDEEFPSKTQCRKVTKQTLLPRCRATRSVLTLHKALKTVWVNIPDFLHAIENGQPVHHFRNQWDLAKYTIKTRRYYPKDGIEKSSPLRQLLAHIFTNQGGGAKGHHGLVAHMEALMIAGG